MATAATAATYATLPSFTSHRSGQITFAFKARAASPLSGSYSSGLAMMSLKRERPAGCILKQIPANLKAEGYGSPHHCISPSRTKTQNADADITCISKFSFSGEKQVPVFAVCYSPMKAFTFTSFAGLKWGLSGGSLKQSEQVLGPNSHNLKSQRVGVVVWAAGKARPAMSAKYKVFAGIPRLASLFVRSNLNLKFNYINFNAYKDQVLRAFHCPLTVTPLQSAVGILLIIMMYNLVCKCTKMMNGAPAAYNHVPVQRGDGAGTTNCCIRNGDASTKNRPMSGAAEGKAALPTQQTFIFVNLLSGWSFFNWNFFSS